jgi:hypothetical protein
MIEFVCWSRRATASLLGSSPYSTTRTAADRVSAPAAARTLAALESTTTAGTAPTPTCRGVAAAASTTTVVPTATMGTAATATGMRTATAVRAAAMESSPTMGTVATTTSVGMATPVRTATVGAAVRTSSAMLAERRVGGASERYNRCKQEAYG